MQPLFRVVNMAPFLSFVLSAVVAGIVAVSAEDLLSCGDAMYFPSQYTCFDGNFLCPIINGDRNLRCGADCYSTSQYTCSDDTLQLKPQDGADTLENCGDARFSASQYVCFDGDFLCPIIDGTATLRCDDACFDPTQYTCTDGALSPVPAPTTSAAPPAPSCVSHFGDSQICSDQGCLQLACCPGLFAVADKCRSPCDFNPSDPSCTGSS
ncbi:carbohydrate binding-domain-containing protein [Mycena pura]|uniref:Carbohydrate binding-domain-containing protein n=1 Tax=Mycena pura TaxID=153505 RepID=A0AAD6UTP9_9AGAR|nr:carbohydrate binding-domain-containing protein [Mycena pura]